MRVLGLSRRRLLQSSAAASLSFLPFTRTLVPAAHAQAATGPRVLVTLYHPFGVVEDAWYPQGGETGFTFGLGSKPLEEIRDDVVMFRNVDNLAGEQAKCGIGVDQHVAGVQTIWTGSVPKDGPGGGIRNLPTGGSIDQLVGEHLRTTAGAKLVAFNFGVRSSPDRYPANPDVAYTNCTAAGDIRKPVDDPVAAYGALFGANGTSSTPTPTNTEAAMRRLAARKSLLDDVTAEATAFERALAAPERERFQSHLGALRALERRLSEEMLPPPPMSCSVPAKTTFMTAFESDDVWATANLQAQLLVLSLSCGLTNVATLNLTRGFGLSYKVPKVVHAVSEGPYDGHNLSHDQYANAREAKINLNNQQARTFVALIKALKATASPRGGTLFDEAIVLWSSCLSGRGGGGHTRVKIPFVVSAGKRSGFVMGRHVDAGGRSQNPILLSTCRAFGMNLTTFGDARFCPGPMTALTTAGAMGPQPRPPNTGYGCQGT